jgi:arylsulfatase A-like enzyme
VRYGQKVGDEPTGRDHPELLKLKLTEGHDATIVNGISRIGFMSGGRAARWNDEDIADVLTSRATRFIEANKDKPFFLYFATHDVHVPRVPHPRFAGKSGCGTRGDVVEEFDWSVGEVVATLERLKLLDDTLLVVTSDNGPVLDDGYADGAVKDLNGHAPAGPWRGGKYTPYEGGTRVPFIVHWPKRVSPGTSDALICQIDLLHSLALLVGGKLPSDAAPDSVCYLPALLGETKQGRDHLIEQGGPLALRKGAWKLVTRPNAQRPAGRFELYDLQADPSEATNVASQQPDVVRELAALLDRERAGPSRNP